MNIKKSTVDWTRKKAYASMHRPKLGLRQTQLLVERLLLCSRGIEVAKKFIKLGVAYFLAFT